MANVAKVQVTSGTYNIEDSTARQGVAQNAADIALLKRDGSVTTTKLASGAVTMEKTDFYYEKNVLISPTWLTITGGEGVVAGATIAPSDYEQAISEFPDILSFVVKADNYWNASQACRFKARTGTWQNKFTDVTRTNDTLTANGETYGVVTITKEDFVSAYNTHEALVQDQSLVEMQWELGFGNVAGRFHGVPVALEGEVTASLIEANFTQVSLSEDFASAVKFAVESNQGTSVKEEEAKQKLNLKVMVCLGDSYTVGMSSLLSTIASKYGMAVDNRGVVSSSICGDVNGNKGFSPMWNRANTIISDYSSGYTISGSTYTASDVGIIVFMGGANDGFGVETWIGTGIHETDKETIYGACNHIFNVLQESFSNAKLICVTQPSNYNRTVSSISDDATAQTLGFENLAELRAMTDVQFSNYAMAQKERAVKDVAWSCGIPTIDMFNSFPSVFNSSNRSKYWDSDKLHLTSAGYSLIANEIDKKIVDVVTS